MKSLQFLLLFIILSICGTARAENWILLEEGKKITSYYDSESVGTDGDFLSATIKVVYNTPMCIAEYKKDAEYIIFEVKISCKERHSISDNDIKLEWRNISAGTPVEKLYNIICK